MERLNVKYDDFKCNGNKMEQMLVFNNLNQINIHRCGFTAFGTKLKNTHSSNCVGVWHVTYKSQSIGIDKIEKCAEYLKVDKTELI